MESSKFKLNKTKFIQITLLLLAFLLIFFTYFLNLKKKQTSTNLDQIKTIEPDREKKRRLILLLTCNTVALIEMEIDLLLLLNMPILKLIDQILSEWKKFFVFFILKIRPA